MSATLPEPTAIVTSPTIPPAPITNGPTLLAHSDEPRDPRFFWLTVAQYALIFIVAIVFVWVLSHGVSNVKDLADPDTARGLITFVIAVGTIAIAMILALTAVVTREFGQRTAVGKEILTVLVGVLGTIVGFYYGAAKKESTVPPTQPAQVSVSQVKVPEQLKPGETGTLSMKVNGGTPPYHYSIRFTPSTIPAIENQDSATGEINQQFKASVVTGTEITATLEGKDKNNTDFAFNKDGKQKILVRE